MIQASWIANQKMQVWHLPPLSQDVKNSDKTALTAKKTMLSPAVRYYWIISTDHILKKRQEFFQSVIKRWSDFSRRALVIRLLENFKAIQERENPSSFN